MTGPEHYREAERLIGNYQSDGDTVWLAQAQVHATLAQAAATALMSEVATQVNAFTDPDLAAWVKAAGAGPIGGDS